MAWDRLNMPFISANAPVQALGLVQKGINQAGDSLTQMGDIIKQRARNKATRELLGDIAQMDQSDPLALRTGITNKANELLLST